MSGPCCFKGTIHDHAKPTGKIEKLYGHDTYVALPEDNANPKSTIIFYTDAFGLLLINNKLLADFYAVNTGCRVLVPDIIPGGPASLATMTNMNDLLRPVPSWLSYLNPLMYLGKGYNLIVTVNGMLPLVLGKGNAEKAYPVCLKYAREVRAAMPADGKLGAAGFCWGGLPTTTLCAAASVEGGDKPLLDAQFNAHPSSLKPPGDVIAAIDTYKVPYSCAVAEFDFQFDKKAALETEAAVKQKLGEGVGTYEFVIHKDCHHGFSVRASLDEGEVGKRGYEDAAKQAINWFNKYLK